jgi:regulator of replication initiation timing
MKKVIRNVPEAMLRAQISELTLEDVSTSAAFKRIIETSAAAVLKAHNRNRYIKFIMQYAPKDPMTACTDNSMCYLNAANKMFSEDPNSPEDEISVKDSLQRIYGASFHEIGHVLYTCFSEMKRMGQLFENGDLDVPAEQLTGDMAVYYDELKDVLKNDKAVVLSGFVPTPIRDFIISIYMSLMNCIEDGRIEHCLINNDNRFSGLYSGLLTLRDYHKEVLEKMDVSEESIPTFSNLCLMYAKYNTTGTYTGGFEAFDNAKPIIDEMINTHQAKPFAQLNLKLLLCVWPLIRDLILELDMSGGSGNGEGQDGEGQEGDSEGGSQGSGNSQGSEQSSGSSSGSSAGDASEGSSESEGSGKEQPQSAQEALEKKLKEILDEMSQNLPQEQSSQNDSGETKQKENEAVTNSAPRDVESTTLEATLGDIMKQLADKKVRNAAEDEACKAVKDTLAGLGKGFAPYLGTKVISMSPNHYGSSLDENTEAAVKKAAREITRHLEQDMRVGVSKRKFSGKKFHAEKVVNRDFRYFENKTTKKSMPKLKVGLVIDESGSMSSGRRYEYARAAAITLYRIFEYVPNLDIAIYGHSTCGEVEIYDYADFGIKPKDVEKRLQNVSARGGNIDIVTVTAMAENLLKQDADARVMFIITDGLPYSYVRGMTPEEELSEAADKYSRKGIDIIVASIGSDEQRLRSIYKNQRFLNISNPSELPRKVVDVIKRKL